MAASDHLHPRLFHGTGGHIVGDTIKPSSGGRFGPGAYATPHQWVAEDYASTAAAQPDSKTGQYRLFGTVHEVEPMSEKVDKYEKGHIKDNTEYVDRKGLKVGKVVSFPVAKGLNETKQEGFELDIL